MAETVPSRLRILTHFLSLRLSASLLRRRIFLGDLRLLRIAVFPVTGVVEVFSPRSRIHCR